ncbi:Bark storage protein A [Mucuna pruriens]|uniref:Bark storage protein A n=1 Tax=Mucuna pruriens TaxID=157652 RepID=A0A371FMX5_MUCPR|nr:Bark storage protein A [Mucuna pruriens]
MMELLGLLVLLLGSSIIANGAVSELSWREISTINSQGPYIGIVVPNAFELDPLLRSPSFVVDTNFPHFDYAGKHFRIGILEKKRVIVVMCGLGMLNAGLSTQLLLTLFDVKGVLHYGIAGNGNPKLQIGDVTIPQYWAHTGLWHWQRLGVENGDFSRRFGYLEFGNYSNCTEDLKSDRNVLNKVWYQPEEIFPVNGIPEASHEIFWVPVDNTYFKIARKLKNVKLDSCVNTTCLPRKPIVVRVEKGVSANVFVDNKAYREFLHSKFDATPIEMETASVALVCFQQNKPFIAIRSLSDLAGGGSSLSNEVDVFASLASQNAFEVLVKFISLNKHWKTMELLLGLLVLVIWGSSIGANGAVSELSWREISNINSQGPYIGIVVPNAFELDPLLRSPSFIAHNKFPYFDFAGKHFRIGVLEKKRVIVVMTGLSMLNAGITTQLLLTLFDVEGVVHYGIAGNANPKLQIGDVTIPQYWAHTGLWNWQRFGDGPKDELALEVNGDYSRRFGYLRFADYNNYTKHSKPVTNLLNNVWFQAEEIFPVNGTPEVRQHAFWVSVDKTYFKIAGKLENVKLGSCVNTTCLPRRPIVVRVERGASANVFVDNKAYREFLNSKFDITPIDMESAAVALVCLQQKKPFIVIRALSDLAGGGSDLSNEADVFASLASQNALDVVVRFISLLNS